MKTTSMQQVKTANQALTGPETSTRVSSSALNISGADVYSIKEITESDELLTFEIPEERAFSINELKRLNRIVTRKIPVHTIDELIEERNALVKKEIYQGFSPKEKRRLIYIKWQLDRIDDALYGENIDFLETLVEQRNSFAQNLRELLEKLDK